MLVSKEAAEMWLHGLHLIAAPDGEAMPPPTYVLPAGRWRALRDKAPQHLRPLLAEMYTRQPQIRRINGLDGANDADVVAEYLGGRLGELTETALEAGVRACVRVCACACVHLFWWGGGGVVMEGTGAMWWRGSGKCRWRPSSCERRGPWTAAVV